MAAKPFHLEWFLQGSSARAWRAPTSIIALTASLLAAYIFPRQPRKRVAVSRRSD